MKLYPQQRDVLHAAWSGRGLFGQIPVGNGKTLISALLPTAVGAKRPLLLIPGSMRRATARLRDSYGTLPACEIMSYEALSAPAARRALFDLRPDCVILDEAHAVCGVSNRARRIAEWVREAGPVVCALSGTLLGQRVEVACTAAELVWRERSPLPRHRRDVLSLSRLVHGTGDARDAIRWARAYGPRDPVMASIAKRICATPGGVVLPSVGCPASIVVEVVPYEQQPIITDALTRLGETWELDGVILCDATQTADTARQLRSGFYYRPRAPMPAAWQDARRAWSRAVRQYARQGNEADSEALIVRALTAGTLRHKGLADAWTSWRLWATLPMPPSDPVWLDTGRVRAAASLADGGLVWYRYDAEGEALASLGLPRTPHGRDPEAGPAVVSVGAHGTGRNLQAFARSTLIAPLPAGLAGSASDRWEQLIGRTHRAGQLADVVRVVVLDDGCGDLERAVEAAKVDAEARGERGKLLLGLGE